MPTAKHGINALPASEHSGKGRVSIILWGQCDHVVEEANSPSLVVTAGKGKGGGKGRGGKGGKGRR